MLPVARCLRAAAALLVLLAASTVAGARARELECIQIMGTEFRTSSGAPVWLNGINAAWIRWNDFGAGRFDRAAWHAEFARYAAAGVNCARVWIDCDGEVAVAFDDAGRVTGPAAGFVDDLASFFAIARGHGVRVLAVLTSFDHVKAGHPAHRRWRRLFNDDDIRATYVAHFIGPLAARFRDEPALFAWEICNEPEWIWFRRQGVARERVIAFHAQVAAALHRYGSQLVTTGSASWLWHRDRGSASHPWSDASLARHSADPGARLDFFQVHYYDWMAVFGWSPFGRGASPARFLRKVDRPVIIGETRGRHSWWTGRSVERTYHLGRANGYAGVFGWSAHGADGHGNFAEIAAATRSMAVHLGLDREMVQTEVPVASARSGREPAPSDRPGTVAAGEEPWVEVAVFEPGDASREAPLRDPEDGAVDETI